MTLNHARIVTVADLLRFAETTRGQEVLPELIRRLIQQSCRDFTLCRIPGLDDTNQPGLDGVVVTQAGAMPFVPPGESWWETSNQRTIQKKADKVVTERAAAAGSERAAFVFATFRRWPKQREWRARHKDLGFRDLLVLDATQLADWLSNWPAVARWLLTEMGLASGIAGLHTLPEHWTALQTARRTGDPEIPPTLFLARRAEAVEELRRAFEGTASIVWLGVESGVDAWDFTAAVVKAHHTATGEDWSMRCVLIDSREAWAAMVRLRTRHVLVAGERLGVDEDETLWKQAVRAGHAVVVPLRSDLVPTDRVRRLPQPSPRHAEKALVEAGWTRERVAGLISGGFTSLAVLKGRIAGSPLLAAYQRWSTKRDLALAGLIGGWLETNDADLGAVSNIVGVPFAEWRVRVQNDMRRQGAPLVQRDGRWRVMARGEVWVALGREIVIEDLHRLRDQAVQVLGESDPSLDLPPEQRLAAAVYGRAPRYSPQLRTGLAETLALLGSRPEQVGSGLAPEVVSRVAERAVRELLDGAEATRWLSIQGLLPLLAEASPDEFLRALERALQDPAASPFPSLFAEESGGFMGRSYTTGLLWGLETLAWHPDYFSRVVLVLAALASVDPGGKWMNRPDHSLSTILLPWLPQTSVASSRRAAALGAAAKEFPSVAWKVLLSLLPGGQRSSFACRKPTWRAALMEGWEPRVSERAYVESVEAFADLAVDMARRDTGRLAELVARLPNLPEKTWRLLLDDVIPAMRDAAPEEALTVWEAICRLVERHRAFPDADWAMPEAMIGELDKVAALVEPTDPALRHRRLFGDWEILPRAERPWREQEARIATTQAEALQEVLTKDSVTPVLAMVARVKKPGQLGKSLGSLPRPNDDAQILPAMLDCESNHERDFVAGFVWGRWCRDGWTWVDALDTSSWGPHQVATLFTYLPFTPDTWQRVDRRLDANASTYWRVVPARPCDSAATDAAERFLHTERPRAALEMCGRAMRQEPPPSPDLLVRTLRACLQHTGSDERFDYESAREAIYWLQQRDDLDRDVLFDLEWGYLGLLDRSQGPGPKTIESRFASSAKLFCEAVRLVFRSDSEEEQLEQTEQVRLAARAAFRVLSEMSALPGRRADGSFDGGVFNAWVSEVGQNAAETGHLESAFSQVGQLLGRVAVSDDWMTTLPEVATALDAKDADRMRKGFAIQLHNNRGVYSPSGGKEERALAAGFAEQAQAAEARGWIRLAATLRGVSRDYEREANQEERDEDEGMAE